jgi:hypothetical protein
MSDKINQIRAEVKKAEQEVKRVKEVNFHKYNNFVMDKVLEINKEKKAEKEEHSRKVLEDASFEAAVQMRRVGIGKSSFGFTGLDKIFKKD